MEVKAIKIQDFSENEWKDYFYLDNNRTLENTDSDELEEFKKDRLEQYKRTPENFKVEECLLIYKGESFGWFAYSFKGESSFFIFDTKLERPSDEIIKALLTKVYEIILSNGKEAANFWSKNPATSDIMKKLGAEFIEETKDEIPCCQFSLTKTFLSNNIK